MNFYIRHRQGVWITFIHDTQELRDFISSYIPNRYFVLGDLSTYNRPMLNLLLKFVEDNPIIDVYSSTDLYDSVLLSRFPSVIKDPVTFDRSNSVEQFLQSDKSYLSACSNLASANVQTKLRAPLLSQKTLKLLL